MSVPRVQSWTGTLLLVVVTAFVTWAAVFEIDQTVRAQGQVIPQDRTQVVQTADGGVLQELLVSEGERVRKGQLLASLEKERAEAAVDEVEARIANLEITRVRAIAEATETKPDFGRYARTHRSFVAVQQALYQQNFSALRTELEALEGAMHLAMEEYELTLRLFDTGDVSRVELMRAERQVVDLRQRRDGIRQKYRTEARKEVARIDEELASQLSKRRERQSILGHTDIVSPMDGVVKFLRINTLGGVLRAGDELMQISPTEGGYVVEAKISPPDIGQLSIGMPVAVRMDAFDYTIYGALQGRLVYLSSDTLSEQGQGGASTVYYRGHVLLDPQQSNPRLTLEQLKAGMTASIDVQTGRSTVLTYIAKPILRAFSGAMTQK
ncbi:MAG: HlyD family efflux transporter periplasmic adaptor subunit [Rubrivivax sp.]